MTKFAFVIGINYNFIHESKRLTGCIHDAMRIKNMLVNSLGFSDEHIYILTDEKEDATSHLNITTTLESLKNMTLRTYDELWIYYSGHGNAISDTNGDENDGKDSVILPSDYMKHGYISDDDLYNWLQGIQCKTIMIFDSCHSGTIADLPWKFTYREPSNMLIEKERDVELKNKYIFTLSGSTDTQKSWEIYNKSSNQSYGEFTNAFLRVLENNQFDISIMKLYEQISQHFLTKQFGEQEVNQTPLLCSSSRIPDWVIKK